jgi:hypothetical protein
MLLPAPPAQQFHAINPCSSALKGNFGDIAAKDDSQVAPRHCLSV